MLTLSSPKALAVGAAAAAAAVYLYTRRKYLGYAGEKDRGYDPLTIDDLGYSPVAVLRGWLAKERPPVYVVVATSSPEEGATARTVVLQDVTDAGALVFGTAANSLKARSLAADPRCAVPSGLSAS